jgi:carbon storage regulator CsrA
MLVLTRREEQKIVFPTVGITVDVLRIKGNVVKIGIDAPQEVPVLRHEIADETDLKPRPGSGMSREARHALLNRLNAGTIALHLLKRQLEAGRTGDADNTFHRILEEFSALEGELQATRQPEEIPGGARETPVRRALLVEDDKNESELLSAYLRMCGYEVTSVPDGVDAIEFLGSHSQPDVVLLDMLMPRCNGARTIDLIRRNPKLAGLKVFAISGTAPDSLGVTTGPRGVDRWFSKPVNPETLVQEMNRELAGHGKA